MPPKLNLLSNENKRFDCSHCSKKYQSQSMLNAHIRYEHSGSGNRKKKKTARCEQCDKVLSSKTHLKRHMDSLHSETPTESVKVKCPHCSNDYPSIYLQNHLKRMHAS